MITDRLIVNLLTLVKIPILNFNFFLQTNVSIFFIQLKIVF